VKAKADPFTIEEMRPLEAKVFHLGSLLNDDFPAEVVKYLSTKGTGIHRCAGVSARGGGVSRCSRVVWTDKEEILPTPTFSNSTRTRMTVITDSKDPLT
jgi:hypothetical protein